MIEVGDLVIFDFSDTYNRDLGSDWEPLVKDKIFRVDAVTNDAYTAQLSPLVPIDSYNADWRWDSRRLKKFS